MIENRLIQPSTSPWSSPMHLVKKADGSLRITIDFRLLNNITIKDAYALPMINVILALLAKAKYRSKFDLLSGYYQIPLAKNSRAYTAFPCELGLFEFCVMPMGLTNATATFQRFMDFIFADINGIFEAHFLDDIFIFSDNLRDHVAHLRDLLARLQFHSLFLSSQKCLLIKDKI
jgi:hypothetical protein